MCVYACMCVHMSSPVWPTASIIAEVMPASMLVSLICINLLGKWMCHSPWTRSKATSSWGLPSHCQSPEEFMNLQQLVTGSRSNVPGGCAAAVSGGAAPGAVMTETPRLAFGNESWLVHQYQQQAVGLGTLVKTY